MRPKKIILCVDDDEHALGIRRFMLETRKYKVLSASSGEAALDILLQSGTHQIALLWTDLVMANKMDGNELVKWAKELHPDLPCIITSDVATSFDRANRADAFFPKGTYSPSEILERIRVMTLRKRGPKKATCPALTELQHQIA